MPFCHGEPISGGVILLQAEDDLGATVKASIEAAGGDPRRIRVYTKDEPLYLDDADDLSIIRQAAKEIDARLLVADPFSEFFSKTLKDEKIIRDSFRLLRKLAAELMMAVILIRHFTKIGTHALYRGLGGVAVVNSARSALVVGHDPSSDDPYRHVLALNRCNLPRNRDISLAYRTLKQGDAIVIEWQGESKYSADDVVTAAKNPDDHSQLDEACYILYAILTTHGGPMAATDIYQAAKDGLVSVGTLKRAKKMLRVCSRRKSVQIIENGTTKTTVQWVWQLPDDQDLLRPYQERLLREQEDDGSTSTGHRQDIVPERGLSSGPSVAHNSKKRNISKQTLSFSCSKSMQYLRTPPDIWQTLSQEFRFTVDACASHDNHLLPKYYTTAEDGLQQDWTGEVVYCHPMFDGKIGRWVEKAFNSRCVTVMLLPASTHTKYFHQFIKDNPRCEVRFLKKPPKGFQFGHDGGQPDDENRIGYIRPLMIVIFRNGSTAVENISPTIHVDCSKDDYIES